MSENIDLIFILYRLGRHFKAVSKVHNHDHLLSLFILRSLENSGLTNTQLAKVTAIKPSAMSEQIEKLAKAGLIRRTKASDARKLQIKITDKGKQYLANLVEMVFEHSKHYLQNLSDDELMQLINLLKKIEI